MPTDFLSLGVRPLLNEALQEQGIKVPTPVQEQSIPVLLSGKDLVAQAQTGTGKTFAFLLPLLEKINANKTYIQALIIAPTRELALQITNELNKLASKVGVNILAAYGGQDVERQVRKLQGGIHIVVGTPGRILDHIRRGTINLSGVKILVLDEADQMLHMGFLPDVETIISQTNPKRQTMLFSATMPAKIRALARNYMKSPVDIKIESKSITLDEIKQVVIETTEQDKIDNLCELIDKYRPYLAMVFCRTKTRAKTVNYALQEKGYESNELHGDLSQAKREQVMRKFREAKLQILVATDLAARGLDVEGITHVFNYDIPEDADSYIHRIGRTGRAGETGLAITLATQRDKIALQMIEKGIGKSVEKDGTEQTKENRTASTNGEKSSKQVRKGGSGNPGKATGTAKSERTSRSTKPERSNRSAKPEKSNRSGKPDRPGRSERSDNKRSDSTKSEQRGKQGNTNRNNRQGSKKRK